MDKQEIYDFVATKLMQQGEPAFKGNSCCYLLPDGKRCAIGWLLEGNLLEESRTFPSSLDSLMVMAAQADIPIPAYFYSETQLLRALQSAHDLPARAASSVQDMSIWKEGWTTTMRKIAVKFNLNAAVLENVDGFSDLSQDQT